MFMPYVDAPQCYANDSLEGEDSTPVCGVDGTELKHGDGFETADGSACLSSLSDDILLDILLYCGPTDVERGVKLVNRRFQ